MDKEKQFKLSKKSVAELPDDPKILKKIIYYLLDEIQSLKDEINKLKGEKGKPKFNKKNKNKTLGDIVENKSEKKAHKKSSKKNKDIPIHDKKKIEFNELIYPKYGKPLSKNGSKKIIIQDIEFKLHNTEYELEGKCCSNKDCDYIVSTSLPDELRKQEFGKNIRTLTPFLHYSYGLSQDQLYHLCNDLGLSISKGSINAFIQEGGEKCINLSNSIFSHHLKNNNTFNIDETGWKTKGINKYLYVLSNKFMSFFSIKNKRNSDTVKDILFQSNWNKEDKDLVADVFIISDDHSSYSENKVKTLGRQLCWIHENRHYKKLIPFTESQIQEGKKVLSELWDLYRDIQSYRKRNIDTGYNEMEANEIEMKFDKILSQEVNWKELKHQMLLTYKKKSKLLLCLKHLFLEPHNNRAEQDLRPCVVIRNKNFGTRSENGEKHFASARSVIATLRKLGKNVYENFKNVINETISIQELLPT